MEFTTHLLNFHKETVISCSHCGKDTQIQYLKSHLIESLNVLKQSPFQCIKCEGQPFQNSKYFLDHLQSKHNYKQPQITRIVIKRHLVQNDSLSVIAILDAKSEESPIYDEKPISHSGSGW